MMLDLVPRNCCTRNGVV